MKPRTFQFTLSLAVLVFGVTGTRAEKPVSDIQPPERRRAVVEMAERLAHPTPPAAVPADLPEPFRPPGFDKPDPSAVKAPSAGAPGADKAPPAPQSDRDLLASLADKIPTTGTIILGNRPLLISGTNRIEAGSRFTVVYNGQEYELELVAIERTTFTVRYKGEEFTRPIKIGKSP